MSLGPPGLRAMLDGARKLRLEGDFEGALSLAANDPDALAHGVGVLLQLDDLDEAVALARQLDDVDATTAVHPHFVLWIRRVVACIARPYGSGSDPVPYRAAIRIGVRLRRVSLDPRTRPSPLRSANLIRTSTSSRTSSA